MSETDNVSSEPGSGIAAAKRASKIAPPPPPPPPPPEPAQTKAATTSEVAAAPHTPNPKAPKTKKPKPKAEPEDLKLLGRPAGRLRQVLVHLRKDTRTLLDQAVTANNSSLGVEAMTAVRSVHQQLRQESPAPAADDGFAPARRVVRQMPRGEAKVPTTLTISPEEAAALQELAAAVSASVALVVDECILRRHTPRLTDDT